MTQQFRIDSTALRDKVNSLLPSQARGSIDVDLSGQTTIVPIVDLTETAEGSSLRQDLQTSFSLTSSSAFLVTNATTTLVNTTGYYRVFGLDSYVGQGQITYRLTDGTTTKILFQSNGASGQSTNHSNYPFDFMVFLEAGDSLTVQASTGNARASGVTRQIATLSGELVNP